MVPAMAPRSYEATTIVFTGVTANRVAVLTQAVVRVITLCLAHLCPGAVLSGGANTALMSMSISPRWFFTLLTEAAHVVVAL